MISVSTHRLHFTLELLMCSHLFNSQSCMVCLSPLHYLLPLVSWTKNPLGHRRLSQVVPLLPMLVSHRCTKPRCFREFSCRDGAALPPPGHQANASEQAEVGTWETLHVSLEPDCRKKWKCQKGLVCQWLKWLWHEGTEGCQNQNNKRVSLKAVLMHCSDRCAAPH